MMIHVDVKGFLRSPRLLPSLITWRMEQAITVHIAFNVLFIFHTYFFTFISLFKLYYNSPTHRNSSVGSESKGKKHLKRVVLFVHKTVDVISSRFFSRYQILL